QIKFLNNLNVLKYDKLNDYIICEKSSAEIVELASQYNRRMIYIFTNILNQNPKIADLYDLIEDETVKNVNVYYQEFLERKYFYNVIYKESKQLKKLCKTFE